MATAYPDPALNAPGTPAKPAAGGTLPDRRLRLEDILKLMVADGLVLPADAERVARSRTQR